MPELSLVLDPTDGRIVRCNTCGSELAAATAVRFIHHDDGSHTVIFEEEDAD